jgi:hypothetical protein
MKIFLQDQHNDFERHLAALLDQPVMKYSKQLLPKKVSIIDLLKDKELNDISLDFFFNYSIFPSSIMTFMTQWSVEKRAMKLGDTILQQVFIPPFKYISQKIIFGVRINSMIDEKSRRGFSYETLHGHVERGESTFTIEETDKGLIFKIQTFSEPGNFFSKLVGPVFSFPYQAYCTKKALENVKEQIDRSIN